MAAKGIDQTELEAAVKQWEADTPKSAWALCGDGEKKDQFRLMVNGSPDSEDKYVWLEDGKLRCSDAEDFGPAFYQKYLKPDPVESLRKTPGSSRKPVPQTPKNMSSPGQTSSLAPVVRPDMPIRDIQVAELTFEDIKTYICPAASDKDTMMFLKLCQARNLNPFTGEAYLIPFKDGKSGEIKCSMVVSKEAIMRKAEANPHYRGFKAGIILSKDGGDLVYREGSFLRHGETLEGGWSEVYRDDRDFPIRSEDSLKEYDSGKGLWATGKKETMIRKVSVAKSHREAFPADLSYCYGTEEIGLDPAKEIGA